ncbi:NlpC/P60 family protein [Roseinatronobacter alkalisoli]|uniref:NlpC/P60 family protein n=1 Tax=Roseinatronobacter alkalisoli TaxID=3028235 RepID=A0ABT5T940_9RHOB|nr:NlpC/P60 family protein [Roseinatronobacter sp. HJB301]MDD7971589.1 NlpC/P60 family protein [Roseinatronobacter sp. HJB301]
MSDPRLTPFSGRVALDVLRPVMDAPQFTSGTPMRVGAAVADLLRHPDGPRDRQVLRGAALTLIDQRDGYSFVQLQADGYCGWLRDTAMAADHAVTHRVCVRATHLYSRPDLKSPELGWLSLNTQLLVTEGEGQFLRAQCGGWVPVQHVVLVDRPAPDPVAVAEMLLGTPYLWGGNSSHGIDCSGLVQLALQACNMRCPADSDLQAQAFGPALPAGTAPRRGDLLFWRGHVAFIRDADTILHANAHTMSVALEGLRAAMTRIAAEAAFIAHIRPTPAG